MKPTNQMMQSQSIEFVNQISDKQANNASDWLLLTSAEE